MKKTLILISMIAMSSVAMAQTGSWYAGGMLGYGSATSKDANDKKDVTNTWSFSPEIGTFLKDDIQVGIVLGLGGSTSKYDGTEYNKTSSLSPTIYGRKFFKVTDNFNVFGGLYLNYISGKTNETDQLGTKTESKQSGFGAKLGVGVTYALSPRFTAVGQYGVLGYQNVNNKVGGNDAGSDSNFGLDINTTGAAVFNIGIYYTFLTK